MLAIGIAIFSFVVIRTMPAHKPPTSHTLEQLIKEAANDARIPLGVFVRLLESESDLDPAATGPANTDGSIDRGIAQLNSKYLEWFGHKYGDGKVDPYNPWEALPVAAKYLSDLADVFDGCWACAVGAYKRGPAGWGLVLRRGSPGASYESIGGKHSCGGR